ncbi:hypothetical protein [Photobacterium leiognathi]|uniref:hypothetical protein n=1 Tax=Photobacterium leiognathi TaxID=553611 RepID=UPI0029825A7B|nr:hypothetical protein [Photobacterium leiognathi]
MNRINKASTFFTVVAIFNVVLFLCESSISNLVVAWLMIANALNAKAAIANNFSNFFRNYVLCLFLPFTVISKIKKDKIKRERMADALNEKMAFMGWGRDDKYYEMPLPMLSDIEDLLNQAVQARKKQIAILQEIENDE